MSTTLCGHARPYDLCHECDALRYGRTVPTTVELALAWLRAQKPKASPRTYHADAAATLLILAGLHDRGMMSASVADVALYACLSESAVRDRLLWLADGWPAAQRVVLRHRAGRRVWYRVDVHALTEGTKPAAMVP